MRDAVDVLAQIDPADLGDVALADEVLELRRQMDRQDAVFASLAWVGHTRGVGNVDGAASTASWLRHRAGMREGDAKTALECGEVGDLLAETGRAWRAGEISTGAMRTIAAARVVGHDDKLAAVEPELLELARRDDLRSLRQATKHFRNLALADGSEPGDRDGLFVAKTYGDRTTLSGEFTDLAAETITTTLRAYIDPPSDDGRTTAQRTAAALVQICEVALSHIGDVGKVATQVSLVVDWATLTGDAIGRMDGEFTGPIHPQDVQQALCDSSISRIVTGPDSAPLEVGRAHRAPPPSMRRALVARDEGCRFPGCNRPPGWCQAHHVVPWTDGGPTDLDNLVLLCSHHHRVVHRRGWTITFDGDGLRVLRPDGSEMT